MTAHDQHTSAEEVTAADLDRLEALAKSASPGPWDIETTPNEGEYGIGDDTVSGFTSYRVEDAAGKALVDTLNSEVSMVHEEYDEDGGSAWDEVGRANAKHIAAFDPPTALRLIALARRTVERQGEGLEAALLQLMSVLERLGYGESSGRKLGSAIAKANRALAAALHHPTPNSADGAENGRKG